MKRPVIDQNTGLALAGLAALAVGLWLIYPPGALIAVGALLIIYAIMPDRGTP